MADLELMDNEEINDRQIVLSRGTKPSASRLKVKGYVNHPGGYRRSGFRAGGIPPLHMISGSSIGLSNQSSQRRKALASAELFEDELDLFDDMEYAGEQFDSEDDDEFLSDEDDELEFSNSEMKFAEGDIEHLNSNEKAELRGLMKELKSLEGDEDNELEYAGGKFSDDDDEFLSEEDDDELEFSNSKMEFSEADMVHLNSNEKAELKSLMKELKSMEAEDDAEPSMMPSGGNAELDDLLEDLREEFPDEEFVEGRRWKSFKRGLNKKQSRRHERKADKHAIKSSRKLKRVNLLKSENKRLQRLINTGGYDASQIDRLERQIIKNEGTINRLEIKGGILDRRTKDRRGRALSASLRAREEFPAWVEKEYAARTASEYHDMAKYYTDPRQTDVNWSELHFPISMKFSLDEAQNHPEVAQWSLGKLLEHNKVIQKIFNSGEFLGDVVMHTIRHNAPVSLGFTASMEGRKGNVFYEPNTCPTEAQVDLVHTHVTKKIAGIPQIPGKETLRTRPDTVSATFLDRYGTDWNMNKIRKDAVVPAGEKNAMPSSRSPLVGYLVMEREFLDRDLIDSRGKVPVNKEMAEKAMDIIETEHKQILRMSDLSNMHITAVRTTGSSWDDTVEVGNDLRLSSAKDKNKIIDNRLASPIVVQGVLTVSRGKAQQIQPEQSLEDYNAEMVQQHQAAVEEHQILAQVAAETVDAHDQKAYVDAAKKAGYHVNEPEPEQQQQQQYVEENYPQEHQVNVPAGSEVHYIEDPVSHVIYKSVAPDDEVYRQQQQQEQQQYQQE